MNQVNLVGRVAREVQVRQASSGKSFVFITLGIDGYWNRKEQKMTSDFVSITVWGKEAERCSFLIKGSLIRVSGRVSTGSYVDKETGEKRYTTDIIGEEVFFLSKPRSATLSEEATG